MGQVLAAEHEDVMIASSQGTDGLVPLQRFLWVFFFESAVCAAHEPRYFLLELRCVILCFEIVIQSCRVLGGILALCEVHHSFLKVRERHIVQGCLLGSLLDQKILRLLDMHVPDSSQAARQEQCCIFLRCAQV